jgi:hypothetical protein
MNKSHTHAEGLLFVRNAAFSKAGKAVGKALSSRRGQRSARMRSSRQGGSRQGGVGEAASARRRRQGGVGKASAELATRSRQGGVGKAAFGKAGTAVNL